MKRLILSSIFILFVLVEVVAQVNQVGSTGPIGIGTGTNPPQAYLHVFRPASPAVYTPIALFEEAITNGYTQVGFKGTGRQYHVGVGNHSETAFGIANKFYIWDQNAVLPRFVVDASGNIGIGTTTPGNRLSIYSATANTSGLQFSRLNNTATAVAGNGKVLSLDGSGNVILVNESTGTTSGWDLLGNSGTNPASNYIGTSDNQPLVFKANNSEIMRISADGNISIGTNDAKGHKFAVNGDAVFTKIKVKALLNWPDYVFSSIYNLRSLDELEKYINAYKHLPEIPSADEIEKEGLDVANNQASLLKKIEELTLYIISQNKMISQQQEMITDLQHSFTEQKKDLDQIRMNMQNQAN